MGQETPQTRELTEALLAPGDTSLIEEFKNNPDPLLEEHGVQLTDQEHERLRSHLARQGIDELHEQLLGGGLHTMF